MPFKIMTHLVLDNGISLSSLRLGKKLYRYTEEGMLLYLIKGVVPIISKGRGCIGVAVIKSLNMDENTTAVDFEFSEVDKNTAKVLYSMYLNNTSMLSGSNESDPYNQDVSIPGAVSAPNVNLAEQIGQGSGIMSNIMRTINGGNSKNSEIRDTRPGYRGDFAFDDDDD